MSAAVFVAAARTLKGSKWRHHGRRPHAVDCIGLIALAFWQAGYAFNDELGYSPEPHDDLLRQGARARWGAPLSVSDAQSGDIALIRWGKSDPSHIAIIADHPTGGLSLIHANIQHGVIEQSMSGSFASIVAEIYRPKWGSSGN